MRLARQKIELLDGLNLKKHEVIIFTDGSSSNNGTRCMGYASITINAKGGTHVRCGNEKDSTNNRAELMAIIDALEACRYWERKRSNRLLNYTIVSDSGYCVFPFTNNGWIEKFKRNQLDKNMINADLWFRAIPLFMSFGDRLSWIHVTGHAYENKAKFKKARSRGQNITHDYYNHLADGYSVEARYALERELGLR